MEWQKVKKGLKKIFFLQTAFTLLISIPSYGLVIYVLAGENVNPAIAYASYLLSAYALVITVTGIVRWIGRARQRIAEHPLVRKVTGISLVDRYVKEDIFRAEAALYQGFLVNGLYAAVKMISGILYCSVWLITLAVYYMLLAAMRASLLHYVRGSGKSMASAWRRYGLCGGILLFMNVALSGMVILMVHQNQGFEYPGMLIYIMAMYTFYATITAFWNVRKFRRYGSPVLSAAKIINLTAALVSMLSLETAMLAQFGEGEDPVFRRIMTASTGGGISILVLGMAVFMIVTSGKQLRYMEQERRR